MTDMKNKEIHVVYDEAKKVIEEFSSNEHDGLTSDKVVENRQKYGKNEITPPEKDPLWKQFLNMFKDPTIIILCICAVVTVLIGIYEGKVPYEGFGIIIAVLIATGVGFWSEYKADKAFETLKADNENIDVKVIRDGKLAVISTKELVAGDIIELESGDKVPADAVLINCVDMTVDESLMTGESEPVRKNSETTGLIGGTMVVNGSGKAIVSKVGEEMQMGEILKSLSSQEEDQTPLQYKLEKLANLISTVGLTAAILIFFGLFSSDLFADDPEKLGVLSSGEKLFVLISMMGIMILTVLGLVKGSAGIKKISKFGGPALLSILLVIATFVLSEHVHSEYVLESIQRILEFFIIAVTIIVVAVPEGLPMAVTISLALSMRKIRKDNNLVRKMLATETIGSVNIIASDKTGTLTQNKMTVNEFYFNGKSYNKDNFKELTDDPNFGIIKVSFASNSTANLKDNGNSEPVVIGNMTEGAMLKWLKDVGIDYENVREATPVYDRISFNSDRKMMTTVTGQDFCKECVMLAGTEKCSIPEKNASKKGCAVVLTKGAPEKVLDKCSKIYINGKLEEYKKNSKKIDDEIDKLTKRAMRIIAVAYKVADAAGSDDDVESDLILLGLVGISDPVREDVPAAIQTARNAGIKVIMVTGDSVRTARAIAEEIGFLEEKHVVLEGSEFRDMSDEDLLACLDNLRVLARATPSDKERLVRLVQSKKLVVAVTGDGTNDAPALKKADVGISMGLKGTDVAKEASDIVLTDDNFGSIVKAVKWGRTLYENVQKFLQFQLTINFSALSIAFLSPILKVLFPEAGFSEVPFTVIQLLWVNLVMDTLAALALGLEPPRDEIMFDKPKKREESFLTSPMLFNIGVMGVIVTLFILIDQAVGLVVGDYRDDAIMVSSVIFTTYVFIQVFNLINSRVVKPGGAALKGILKSYSFLGVVALIVVVQIIITQFGGEFFRTKALPIEIWGKIMVVGLVTLAVGAILRTIQKSLFVKE